MATQLKQAQIAVVSAGLDDQTPVEIAGTAKSRVAVVTLPNGRKISTTITGNDTWQSDLTKNIQRFKNKK